MDRASFTYLMIHGPEFDPTFFAIMARPRFGGELRAFKRSPEGQPYVRVYWVSDEFISDPATPFIEDVTRMLLRCLLPLVEDGRVAASSTITAQIVHPIRSIRDARGFHMSAELARLLSVLGARLDVDVTRLSRPAADRRPFLLGE